MRPARQLARLALVLAPLLVGAGLGCGDEHESPRFRPAQAEPDAAAEASTRVETFVAAPTWGGLVELLGQGHATTRELWGPHRLHYTAKLATGPARLDPAAPLPEVGVGEPILERFALTDELELRWGSTPGEPPRLSLDQHNEHELGRSLIVLDGQVWSRLDGRTWYARPLEADLWELWADDAQHAVLDLVELAGPHAELGAIELVDHEGRPAVHVSLRASEQYHPGRTVEAPTPWRRGAKVEIRGASIVLDRATGLWLSAQIAMRWSFEDSAGREIEGRVAFDGRAEVLAAAPEIRPPAGAKPLPERDRPELLRERMLDGLAGPGSPAL